MAKGLLSEVDAARKSIDDTLIRLASTLSKHVGDDKVASRVDNLESENRTLRELLEKLSLRAEQLEARLSQVEGGAAPANKDAAKEEQKKAKDDDDDDDLDLFGSDEEEDEETEEEKKAREEKLAAYHAKKATKTAVIAKSSVSLNVKPWDDETDLAEMETNVRSIEMDGLVWGGSKLVPVAYGVKMLQILCVIEDAKVSTEVLSEQIQEFEDVVQSVDIAAFNKI